MPQRIRDIFHLRRPAQVVFPIVPLIPIAVRGHSPFRAGADKCGKDQPSDHKLAARSVPIKRYLQCASSIRSGGKQSALAVPNAAIRTDRIQALISDDVDPHLHSLIIARYTPTNNNNMPATAAILEQFA